MKVNGRENNGKTVPSLRVMGKYLYAFGFELGDMVEMTCENEELRIAVVKKGRIKLDSPPTDDQKKPL